MDGLDREYLAKLAHDVRVPLTSIKGYVGLLVEGTLGELPSDQAEILGIVQNNTARIEHLLADLSRRLDVIADD